MISFECDYNNGMAQEILERLIKENDKIQPGYGADEYTISAIEKIKKAIGRDDVVVSLVGGGTETNQLIISALLRRSEGVIAATCGHIIMHEKGYEQAWESPTNQLFFILTEKEIEKLSKDVVFGKWQRMNDGRWVVRFCTSWSTRNEDIEGLEKLL